VLHWAACAAAGCEASGYRVLAQAGGSEGFRELIADTGTPLTEVRLSGLVDATWYEFKVQGLNGAGSSALSVASLPVQTAHGAGSLLAIARAEARSHSREELMGSAAAAAAAASAAPPPDASASDIAARYAQTKADLAAWEARWERSHGRPPTECERAADATCQAGDRSATIDTLPSDLAMPSPLCGHASR
jgi:hypothetical protein